MKLLVAVILVAFAFVVAEQSLDGSKVYSVSPVTKKDFDVMTIVEKEVQGLDFWQRAHVLGREAKVLVPQGSQSTFEAMLTSAGIEHEVLMDDVNTVLTHELRMNDIARKQSIENGRISFTAYNRHAVINAYLDGLASKYPNTVQVRTLGNTTQGRDLKVISISTTGGTDARKPVIIVDAGINAREWIAPSMALYMITKLVEDITESDVVQKIDWLIIPVLNPDGYEHSHLINTRLWKKTRSTAASTKCPGVDANKNFDFKWMQSGASSSACSDIFAGMSAFSEPETSYLRDLLLENIGRTKLYLAIHSFGSYFLYPYCYDGSSTPNVNELNDLGLKVAEAIDQQSSTSKRYLVGNSALTINSMASGTSEDWAFAIGKAPLVYTLKLPGGGMAGYDPPPGAINGIVKETWPGILVLARYVIANN